MTTFYKTCVPLMHDYGKWTVPIQAVDCYKTQWRRCDTCGKVQVRAIRDVNCTGINHVWAALNLVESKTINHD